MHKFQCTFHLHNEQNEAFWAIIPAHRRHINQLMNDEVIVTYAINRSKTKGWLVINAANIQEVRLLIESFPIRPFMRFEVEELFIFDSMIGAPRLILN
ncbi:MAG: hypothetical protein ACO3BD_02940 [Chitinophagaceae bacterium]